MSQPRSAMPKVMLTFSTALPDKVTGMPSQRQHACELGMPCSTLSQRENVLIEKCLQPSAGKKGIFWVLVKCKKGYSKIDKVLWLLLVAAFNNHPYIIVSPNAKDTLHLKNAEGKKVSVPKVLTQVGLGTIFSNIVKVIQQ
jgi:hypothetical protein